MYNSKLTLIYYILFNAFLLAVNLQLIVVFYVEMQETDCFDMHSYMYFLLY